MTVMRRSLYPLHTFLATETATMALAHCFPKSRVIVTCVPLVGIQPSLRLAGVK